jgi:hypothetical protein
MSKTKLELMTERCGRAEVRENNLLVAIEKAIGELEVLGDGVVLKILKAALKANKKEQQLS